MSTKNEKPDLEGLTLEIANNGGQIHIDTMRNLGYDPFDAEWIPRNSNPSPLVCAYCNASWSPVMLELYEESGYCDTCWDSEKVVDIFCSNCKKLVYRKDVFNLAMCKSKIVV